ncbi:MAG: TonB-dependent receptor [Dysgonamonadaceae bacterium]|jgi:iron complex outermembrane receptor protein|nr:TonB-dependent receptor [Dysgonamonadaceae bacterium]
MKKVFLFMTAATLPCSTLLAENIETDSLNALNLREVEVISVRANTKTPVAYSNMDREEIETFNSGKDIPFLLTLTPSVIATSEAGTGIGYTGFRIRGTDANRINITSNGIPLNDPESHGVFWVNMPDFASSLQDLQIQRGVGTSTNGAGAFGASINMKTENVPLESCGELNGSYGSFNTAKATFKLGTGLLNKHWAFNARLSSISSDGFIDRAQVDLQSYFAQGAYFNDNTLLKLITFGGKEKTYHAWDGVPSDSLPVNRTYNPSGNMGSDANGAPLYYENQTDNYRQTHYQLSLLRRLNPGLNLNLALHYTQGFGYYEEYKKRARLMEYGLHPDGNPSERSDLVRQKYLDNDFYGGIFSLDYTENKWTVSLGGGANQYDGNHFGKVIWIKNYADDTDLRPHQEYYRGTGKKADANVYLKANYQLSRPVSLYGDLQYRAIDYQIAGRNDEWDSANKEMQRLKFHETFQFLNPKAGVFYQIDGNNTLYGSFSVAHREPNRNNYTDSNANEIPKPEQLSDYELGYTFNNRTFTAGVNVYYMQYTNQLVLNGRVNDIGEPLTSNVPDSYRAGVELQLGARIAEGLKWNGNLTLSRNKIKDYSEYVNCIGEDGSERQEAEYLGTVPISFSPEIIANSLFSWDHRSFSAGLQSSYAGKQYLDNSGSEERKIDPYFVNNLRLGYRFRLKGIKSLQLNLLINNLFDAQYENNGYVYYSWYEGSGDNRKRNNDLRYFPQAGINAMVHLILKY